MYHISIFIVGSTEPDELSSQHSLSYAVYILYALQLISVRG